MKIIYAPFMKFHMEFLILIKNIPQTVFSLRQFLQMRNVTSNYTLSMKYGSTSNTINFMNIVNNINTNISELVSLQKIVFE